jgi:hypothetical protein
MKWNWLLNRKTPFGVVQEIRGDRVVLRNKEKIYTLPISDVIKSEIESLDSVIADIYSAIDERGSYVP